jgi:ComF family protein
VDKLVAPIVCQYDGVLRPIRIALRETLALLFPVDCAGCGIPDLALCDDCEGQLLATVTWSSLVDGTPLHSALRYEGVARRVILALKEQGRTDVAATLARPLVSVLAKVVGEEHSLVTVPPSAAGLRRRGYDPLALILRKAGYRAQPVLVGVRTTRQQKLLDAAGRAENRKASLRARRNLAGEQFVLVDDVVTTGATVAEAVRALREAEGKVVAVVTLASTPRLVRPR